MLDHRALESCDSCDSTPARTVQPYDKLGTQYLVAEIAHESVKFLTRRRQILVISFLADIQRKAREKRETFFLAHVFILPVLRKNC